MNIIKHGRNRYEKTNRNLVLDIHYYDVYGSDNDLFWIRRKTMKTFPSYDYTLCGEESCKVKKTCMRYLTYKKAVKEKYPYPFAVYNPIGSIDNCMLYVETDKNLEYENRIN